MLFASSKISKLKYRSSMIAGLAFLFASSQIFANSELWHKTLKEAQGQTVYFNAWGGSQTINDYIRWAADQVEQQYQVTVKHVKVTETGDVVSKILAEKMAGRSENGSVDLVWINGENFKAMKENGLLAKAYTQQLPNYALVDVENKPSIAFDFTTPVDNQEAPWGMAQLVFMHDTAHLKHPPTSVETLLPILEKNLGRFSYPALPNFYGTTFVKQALIELIQDKALLSKPVDPEKFAEVTLPLWEYLDKLHPLMWREGRSFPKNAEQMKKLLNNSELFIAFTFNPNDTSNAIENDELPSSVKTYVHAGGTLGNTHFVAIPYNANASAGAKVLANFLMSPQAQLHKASPKIWGDPTVLAMGKLTEQDRQGFANLPLGVATLNASELGKVLLEPHSSWVTALETVWQARYAK